MDPRRIAVVGAGYVGLPLSCAYAGEGFRVDAIDLLKDRVETINRGSCPIMGDEPGLPELLSRVVSTGLLTATTDIRAVSSAEAVFVCVDTPIDENKRPRLDALIAATADVGVHLGVGSLVSIESTLPPGTMNKVLIPVLEKTSGMRAGEDFSVVHCPERVMPGRLLQNLRSYDRILGGLDQRSLDKGERLYAAIVKGRIHRTDLLSAEIAKTVENAYRDVQIAFANEVALACEELGANAFKVRDLVNTCPFRNMHIPGSGVGGHCLPKDSWLFASGLNDTRLEIIPSARRVNESMPLHLAQLIEDGLADMGREVTSARVALLGLAFLRDSDDVRNSPSLVVAGQLSGRAQVVIHDPFVRSWPGLVLTDDLGAALTGADCAAIVTDHTAYSHLSLGSIKDMMRTPLIVDGRNVLDAAICASHGLHYLGLGKGPVRPVVNPERRSEDHPEVVWNK